MNTVLNALKENGNFALTENGAVTHVTTYSDILDMFALCGAYRNRSEEDCITMFKKAFAEQKDLALKCLFYLGDCRGGQGERRFFRVCFKWLAENYPAVARKNIEFIPEYRRWDDVLYACAGTPVENDALAFVKKQLTLDVQCKTPSLLAKWLPSENASSKETRAMGQKVRLYLEMTHKQYRKTLSVLRERINIVERLMSAGEWEKIEFDKIPSKAGLIYRNAFAAHDFDRYNSFAQNKNTKVNADVLNPVDIAHKAFNCYQGYGTAERTMLDKYWNNLKDYYNGREENGLCVVDVSGSMTGQPMEAAVSLGAYIAERGHGPFANHFITFSQHPSLVRFEGADIVDKFNRARRADWGYNTNIEAVFDLLLNTAKSKKTKAEDMPTRLYIFSDMEFDSAFIDRAGYGYYAGYHRPDEDEVNTLLESIAKKWAAEGYELPQVIFWNLDARNDNIPAIGGRFAYVSGFSPVMIEQILSGLDGWDICLQKLLSERYAQISA